jgi:hypothetical protein
LSSSRCRVFDVGKLEFKSSCSEKVPDFIPASPN